MSKENNIPKLLNKEDIEKLKIKYSDNEEIIALIFRCNLLESFLISSSERESEYQKILLGQGLDLDGKNPSLEVKELLLKFIEKCNAIK